MATLQAAVNFARAQAQTDSNGLTDANAIIFANEALVDFHRRLVETGVDASQLQEAYTDGTVNVGTYAYPADMLFLKGIEINYGDAVQANYRLATQVDISNIPGQQSFGWLRTYADSYNPQFDDRGDTFEIFPTPGASSNLSQMIRIFYYLKPTEYTALSDTIAYPESMDVRILGYRIAADYLASLRDFDGETDFNNKYEERVKQYISTLSKGSQQPIQATPLPITGWQF